MLAKIRITDDDVVFAENILFSHGERFDDERIDFIKNLDTIDLQAVPGSGKTTALMAKLLILERNLPFGDDSGVLVISHTNAAVDEIKSKIGKYCPKLFSYPNFVGTIQKFTNKFLAIPFYSNTYNKKPYYIDDEIYNEYAKRFSSKFYKGFAKAEQNNAKNYLRINDLYKRFRYSHLDGEIILTNGYNGKPLDFRKSKGRARNYQDWTKQEKKGVRKWLFEFKRNLFKSGFLCFDDAYCLAFEYLLKHPRIKILLQKRFLYVFVDEMQDMDKHQHDLIEKIFYDDARSTSKYQRIGDKNQAIFSRKVKLDEVWSKRDTLTINGSHRLTEPIAQLVNCFALHRDAGFQVKGLREGNILPHLIVYDDENIQNVILIYSEIINNLLCEGKIPLPENKKGYKAIAWRKNSPDEKKICLSDYFPEFDAIAHTRRIDYSYLENYLNANDKTKNSLAPIQTDIINALLKVLRLENIETEDGRKYTKTSLLAYLREYHETHFSDFKLNLFQWSMALAQGRDVINLVRSYIPNFLALFECAINHSNEFVTTEIRDNNSGVSKEELRKANTVNHHGFDIEMTTIHAEKGKNHIATLYLETFYSRGKGNYESQRLKDQFLFKDFDPNTLDVVKQSAKMMYVGISRPTHLLCVAVHKDRFDKNLTEINSNKWEVIIL